METRKDTGNAAGKGLRYLKERGLKEFTAHAIEKVQDSRFDYQKWICRQQISSVQAGYQKKLILPFMPKIYVLVDGEGKGQDSGLPETIRSIRASTYPNVYAIHALNSQVKDEDFVAFATAGDIIERNAFFEVVSSLQGGADCVYSDEDSWEETVQPASSETVSSGQEPAGAEPKAQGSAASASAGLGSGVPEQAASTSAVPGSAGAEPETQGSAVPASAGLGSGVPESAAPAGKVLTGQSSGRMKSCGKRFSDPLFKPDYDPDYLRTFNYIRNLFVVRAGIIRSLYEESQKAMIPSARNLSDPAYRYELTLRCTDRASSMGGVVHIAKVLYHAKKRAVTEDQDQTTNENMRQVLERDLELRGQKGIVEDGALPGTFHIRYEIPGEPLVSIIIPNRDNASVLENCIWSIRNKTTWKNYEIIVVENNSSQKQTAELYQKLEEDKDARIVRYPHAFHFSRVINEGVKKSSGQYLVLMNNDVTVRTPDWIEQLLAQVSRPGVGAAGPKLLFPDGRVQSAGIVVGLMGYAGSMMVAEQGDDPGYMGRAVLTQNMSAVTAACMMVERDAFLKVGGFPDEFTVALGDVDFCLSLRDAGYRVIFEPTAVMIHHESLTRGAEDTKEKKKRFRVEQSRFKKKREKILKEGDPSYNPNLSRRRCDWSQQT